MHMELVCVIVILLKGKSKQRAFDVKYWKISDGEQHESDSEKLQTQGSLG